MKKENMERIDIMIYPKKRSKNWSNTKNQNIKKQKCLSIIIYNDLPNYSLSDSLSDEVNSRLSLTRFFTLLFVTSYLHYSKSLWG